MKKRILACILVLTLGSAVFIGCKDKKQEEAKEEETEENGIVFEAESTVIVDIQDEDE